MAHTSAAVSSR